MALELTNKIWMWDWVAFFVPYMSDKGVKKLLPASKHSEWAGAVDMTTGKNSNSPKRKYKPQEKSTHHRHLPAKTLTDMPYLLCNLTETGTASHLCFLI